MSTIPYVAGTRTDRARSAATVALLRTLPANEKVVFDTVDLSGLTQEQVNTRSRGLSARVVSFARRQSNKNGLGTVFASTKRNGDTVVATVYTNRSPVDAAPDNFVHVHTAVNGTPALTFNGLNANSAAAGKIKPTSYKNRARVKSYSERVPGRVKVLQEMKSGSQRAIAVDARYSLDVKELNRLREKNKYLRKLIREAVDLDALGITLEVRTTPTTVYLYAKRA